jgi:aspartate 1-decarboxylase
MLVYLLKSKLHRATVTAACLEYEGSLTMAEDLMQAVGLQPYERILCANLSNGERWETYAITGTRGSGAIELNGAVARLGSVGDRLTIMAFTEVDDAQAPGWEPRVAVLDERNHILPGNAT